MLKNERILITGGAGAIGSNLVHALYPHNSIIVLDNLSSGRKEWISDLPNVEVIVGDVCKDEDLQKCFSRPIDYIFHLAANFANQNSVDHPQLDLQTNGMGTLKVLEHARVAKPKRFLYASSSCVYGKLAADGPDETIIGDLETPYAISKLVGEHYTTFYHEHYELPTTIVRIFNCYGPYELPGKYRNVIPNFFEKATRHKPLPIYGTGNETRTFTYVNDIVQGMELAATQPNANGEIFNLGNSIDISIKELAETINKLVGNNSGLDFLPHRKWDKVKHRLSNLKKIKELLGYSPITSLQEGLSLYFQWYLSISKTKSL